MIRWEVDGSGVSRVPWLAEQGWAVTRRSEAPSYEATVETEARRGRCLREPCLGLYTNWEGFRVVLGIPQSR